MGRGFYMFFGYLVAVGLLCLRGIWVFLRGLWVLFGDFRLYCDIVGLGWDLGLLGWVVCGCAALRFRVFGVFGF